MAAPSGISPSLSSEILIKELAAPFGLGLGAAIVAVAVVIVAIHYCQIGSCTNEISTGQGAWRNKE
jgi:hypothetical protein